MIVFGKWRDYVVHDENNIKGLFGDYRFLSNFEVCPVWFDGLLYSSTEAAYQSAKTNDMEKRKEFTTMTPRDSMHAGRAMEKTTYFRSDWLEVKYEVMSSCIFDKFYRNKELREKLLATGDKYIEESNHWKDIYWGVCDGKGESNLGKVLMGIREFWKLQSVPEKKTEQDEFHQEFYNAILASQKKGHLTPEGIEVIKKLSNRILDKAQTSKEVNEEAREEMIYFSLEACNNRGVKYFKDSGDPKKCYYYFKIVAEKAMFSN
jgi:hypothetical protein